MFFLSVFGEGCYVLVKAKGASARLRKNLDSGDSLGADAERSTGQKQNAKLVSGKRYSAAPRYCVQNFAEDIVRAILFTRPVTGDGRKSGARRQNRQDTVMTSCSL